MSSFDADYVVFEQAEESSVSAHESPFATIQVSRRPDSSLEFIVFHPEAETPSVWQLPRESVPDTEKMWGDLSKILSPSVNVTVPADVAEYQKNVFRELKNTGQLLRDILTADLTAIDKRQQVGSLLHLIDSWPEGCVISIESDEYWIPWELVHDGVEFWGSRFILARKPNIPAPAYFESAPHRRSLNLNLNNKTRLSKIVNVVGAGLPANVNRKHLYDMFLIYGVTVETKTPPHLYVAHVVEASRDADIVHFTCHGELEPLPYLRLGRFGQADRRYNPATCLTIQGVRSFGDLNHAIVFANACFSGAPAINYMGMRKVSDFGWAFYVQGVNAYIGTLGKVPTLEGIRFADHFYDALINKQATVGEALRYAKMAEDYKNPFWLLYCLYGDPFARKKVEAV